MNIYWLMEDGESFCIKAFSMSEAVDVCEKSYLEDISEEKPKRNIEAERKFYHNQILQSCSLVGELKN